LAEAPLKPMMSRSRSAIVPMKIASSKSACATNGAISSSQNAATRLR